MMAYTVIYREMETTRQLRRTEKTGDSLGWRTVSDGLEKIVYEVEADFELVQGMARRAAANKSGECRDGALRVRVVSRRRVE